MVLTLSRKGLEGRVENLMKASETTTTILINSAKTYSSSEEVHKDESVLVHGALQIDRGSKESTSARTSIVLFEVTKDCVL